LTQQSQFEIGGPAGEGVIVAVGEDEEQYHVNVKDAKECLEVDKANLLIYHDA